MERFDINTEGAMDFALNMRHDVTDINLNWWECFSNYRTKKWRKEVAALAEKTQISFEDVCDYMGIEVSKRPGFARKLPKHRETYIAVGMAYKQPLDVINRWLVKYGMKRRLYIKDIIGDLIWIYLIEANYRDDDTTINYFRQFESCKSLIEDDCSEIWKADLIDDISTVVLEEKFRGMPYDLVHIELRKFVKENIDAFKAAYNRPRKMLRMYLEQILLTKNENEPRKRKWTLNSIRGYLDDSMINYLSGDVDSININRHEAGSAETSLGIKYIPKNKKGHISICLALGMATEEINIYLEMMGYGPLDAVDNNEGMLINLLGKWEQENTTVKKYKEKYFSGNEEIVLSREEEQAAANQMLQLRRDLKIAYEKSRMADTMKRADCDLQQEGKPLTQFPYLNG